MTKIDLLMQTCKKSEEAQTAKLHSSIAWLHAFSFGFLSIFSTVNELPFGRQQSLPQIIQHFRKQHLLEVASHGLQTAKEKGEEAEMLFFLC